jgi:hypothetical protein
MGQGVLRDEGGANGVAVRIGKEKMFFFEKKNQKTFARGGG